MTNQPITNLAAHHLRITLTVETPIELDQHPGASLRGMLFNSLRGPNHNPALGFCVQRHLKSCANCPLIAACPVALLVSTMNPAAERGRDLPRPYTIEPPLTGSPQYQPGNNLTFGLTLFGEALNLFPYVVMALRQAGPYGLGKKLPQSTANGQYRRGRFDLYQVQAINLLSGETQSVLEPADTLVNQPALPVTAAQINTEAQHILDGLPPDQLITLHFKTPTRLIHQKQLHKTPDFSVLFHRLLDRLDALNRAYAPGDQPSLPKSDLLALADTVILVDNRTRWREVWSFSSRQGKRIPISGLMGQAVYQTTKETWGVLLPYVLWGSIIHAGKNAVKGEGYFQIEPVCTAK